MKSILIAFLAIGLTGCTVADPTKNIVIPERPDHVAIRPPTTSVKLGHLYTTDRGVDPAFYVGDQLYKTICPDDFLDTNALKDLSAYISRVSTTTEETTGKIGGTFGANGTLFGAGLGANLKADREYKVEAVQELRLSPKGAAVIKEALGAECKGYIAEGRVVMLLGAQRADTVTDVTTYGADANVSTAASGSGTVGGAQVSAAVSGVGANVGASSTGRSVSKLVFFTVRLDGEVLK